MTAEPDIERFKTDQPALEAFLQAWVGRTLGSEGAKAYDFIGDTVNTAQRLCDAATAGELLVSVSACNAAGIVPAQYRDVVAKGKRELLQAAVIA